jgi:NCAIR mutase (PurE)-related protein
LHRVQAQSRRIAAADVVIVVAGMEGALSSVVAGLTCARPSRCRPVPDTGQGGGVTALLAMTASCSPGITVVGIDNGFGAACAAVRMLAMFSKKFG